MPYWPPDSPPVPPEPYPAHAPDAGPAPVPFTGPDQSAGNPHWAPAAVSPGTPGTEVLNGTAGANFVSSSPLAAPDVNPYIAGMPSPIYVGGAGDAGGRDDVAGSVAAAVAAAEARFGEHQADTYAQGSVIGDLMTLPPGNLDPGIGTQGETSPSGGFYDPPRGYGA